jgi:hypothetical protein
MPMAQDEKELRDTCLVGNLWMLERRSFVIDRATGGIRARIQFLLPSRQGKALDLSLRVEDGSQWARAAS